MLSALFMKGPIRVLWLLIIFLLFAGCQIASPEDEVGGRITLWHSWPEEDAVVLDEALAQFEEIYPNVRIASVALPRDQLLDEFYEAGNDGLGPAVLIGNDSWIGELASAGLIRPVPRNYDAPIRMSSQARSLTLDDGELYGVALSLAPNALYYNKSMVTDPPETLADLLQEADSGNQIALVPRFEEAYWGIEAFGEGLFDEQSQLSLEGSGFEEWLAWLNEAQGVSGVIMNVDDDSLLELFASGQVAYYVDGPDRQGLIATRIGAEDSFEYGVAPLPEGPHGPAGPLLPAEVVLLYAFTSPEQARIADELAAFLVNEQQSIRFMRELDKVPANPTVSVDRRVYPIVNGFAEQVSSAVIIPSEMAGDPLVRAGDRAYVAVLSGALPPAEAVCQFGLEVAAIQNVAPAALSLPTGCEPTVD